MKIVKIREDTMLNDVYETIPVFENDQFQLRGTVKEDAPDLLRVYSDTNALPGTFKTGFAK